MAMNRQQKRVLKHTRVRKQISGTAERPRLAVFRSNSHIEAQIIDDVAHKTLAASSTKSLKLNGANVENAQKVGEAVAKAAKAAGINEVVFDRGGFVYTGKIKALADAARKAGLKF